MGLAACVAAGAIASLPSPAQARLSKSELAAADAGGEDKVRIDINNAAGNAFSILPGMYPTVAKLIIENRPYKEVADVFKIPDLPPAAIALVKKYEAKLECKAPAIPEGQ